MPRPLLQRFRPESIVEFRAAAIERHRDGVAARLSERRAAAIYLFGYTGEMVLKAAWFSAIGYPRTKPILRENLREAKRMAEKLKFQWVGDFHSLESWARLLILTRRNHPRLSYAEPSFGPTIEDKAKRISASWSVVLRYHKNRPYLHEVARGEDAAKWLLDHSLKL